MEACAPCAAEPIAAMFSVVFFMFFVFFVIFMSLVPVIITVIAFWKICSRVGLPGPLALLMLVPFANLILPLYVAFAKWPAMEKPQSQPAASG